MKRGKLSSEEVMYALRDDPKALQAYREYLDQYYIEIGRHMADIAAARFENHTQDQDNRFSDPGSNEDRYDEESFA